MSATTSVVTCTCILDYSHPPADVRDTAFHYRVQHCRELDLKFGPGGLPERNPQEQYKLKDRVREVLSKDIQGHGLQAHDSIEDAWAALYLQPSLVRAAGQPVVSTTSW